MDFKLSRDRSEGQAITVSTPSCGDPFVGHLPGNRASRYVPIVEVAHDGRAMDLEGAGEVVDRRPARVMGDEHVDLDRREPPLHRV